MTSTTSFLIRLSSVAAVAITVASCAPKEAYSGLEEDDETMSRDEPRVVTAQPQQPTKSKERLEFVEAGEIDVRADRENILSQRLVFFEYDKFAVRTEFLGLISAHGDYLISNRDKAVILQGHADERGSTEYNLALGQNRADAVRDIFLASGVFEDQISTISYGEERPRALGHNEGAWAENRRAEIVYVDE